MGDSSQVLPKIIKKIKRSAIFYLDAHWCGPGTDSVDSDIPLFHELKAINDLRNYADIVFVDDYRLFGKLIPIGGPFRSRAKRKILQFTGKKGAEKELDWRKITEKSVLSCFDSARVQDSLALEDKFIIFLKKDTKRRVALRPPKKLKPLANRIS
ncbi:MAG: hypothetical protein A3D92_05370 [Bacteroidetes bacterium RIFCSPHIGHO2_02_FULL_44_7]|nr:MAG: hypothetical protein A3D92_05370 [Bacteroidetes bacterium RIFCSPHIGHO2_02_FULL_44_7]